MNVENLINLRQGLIEKVFRIDEQLKSLSTTFISKTLQYNQNQVKYFREQIKKNYKKLSTSKEKRRVDKLLCVENMTNSYVRYLLKHSSKLKNEEITHEMIVTKRAELQEKRERRKTRLGQ